MQRVSPRLLIAPAALIFCAAALFAGGRPPGGASVQASATPPPSSEGGRVLRPGEGEVLLRGKGNTVTIKVDPKTGSPNMAVGTQVLDAGLGIPMHMHEREDEVLFVHGGGGVAVVGGRRETVGEGDTVYVPHGVWHGVETRGTGIDLLWVVTPAGLEDFFREVGSPPGAPPKVLTPAQIQDIGRKHGVVFKPR